MNIRNNSARISLIHRKRFRKDEIARSRGTVEELGTVKVIPRPRRMYIRCSNKLVAHRSRIHS